MYKTVLLDGERVTRAYNRLNLAKEALAAGDVEGVETFIKDAIQELDDGKLATYEEPDPLRQPKNTVLLGTGQVAHRA